LRVCVNKLIWVGGFGALINSLHARPL
jgi:hypothetical protein